MKIKLKYFTLLFAFILLNWNAVAQSTDEKLADQYFQNKEYDKAIVYYEKIYNKNPLLGIYDNYLMCLLQLKEYKQAEKIVKKQLKLTPSKVARNVDLGIVYQQAGDANKAIQTFESAIKNLTAEQSQVFELADAFVKIKEWDYAIETYKRGRKLLNGSYPFNMELAEVYQQKGDGVAMINEYLDVLQLGDAFLPSVQNALQTSIGNEANIEKNEIIKTQLLKRVQQNPDKQVYAEFLIWMYIQRKEFDGAFVQIKALDKRNKEDGARVMDLAKTCVSNEEYDVAIKAYKYVIEKGNQNYYHASAKMELLFATNKKIIAQNNYTQQEVIDLEKQYIETLTELGKNQTTVALIKSLANLQAFYLYKTNDAIALLEEAIQIPQLTQISQADCKLLLADILLMTGDIWEASLTYSQVEKAFKYDVIGQEAKFRNARVAFYTGDFKWSQAQLDVLKGSTSKLIANDAMALSILISDNVGWDSIEAPLLAFARADLLFFQNKDEKALVVLDSIDKKFPNHKLADEILYKRYQLSFKKKNYDTAATYLQKIMDNYSDDILGDDALFYLAELNETKLNNKTKAQELYQSVLLKYPGSLFTVEARKRYRKLRGDTIN